MIGGVMNRQIQDISTIVHQEIPPAIEGIKDSSILIV